MIIDIKPGNTINTPEDITRGIILIPKSSYGVVICCDTGSIRPYMVKFGYHEIWCSRDEIKRSSE